MRIVPLTLLAASLLSACSSSTAEHPRRSGGSSSSHCATPGDITRLRGQILAQTNAYRRSQGLGQLAPDHRLHEAAQRIACDNAMRGRLDHIGQDGSRLGQRIRDAGGSFSMSYEILTIRPTAERALTSWQGSPQHDAAIRASDARLAGAGIAITSDGNLVWAQVFTNPRH